MHVTINDFYCHTNFTTDALDYTVSCRLMWASPTLCCFNSYGTWNKTSTTSSCTHVFRVWHICEPRWSSEVFKSSKMTSAGAGSAVDHSLFTLRLGQSSVQDQFLTLWHNLWFLKNVYCFMKSKKSKYKNMAPDVTFCVTSCLCIVFIINHYYRITC